MKKSREKMSENVEENILRILKMKEFFDFIIEVLEFLCGDSAKPVRNSSATT